MNFIQTVQTRGMHRNQTYTKLIEEEKMIKTATIMTTSTTVTTTTTMKFMERKNLIIITR